MRLRTQVAKASERVGPRTLDAAFVLVGLAAAAAEALARRHEAVAVWSVVGATAALGALSLWWRRSHPVVVTLIGLVTFAATGLPVVIAVGLFTLATQRRDRVLVALTLATVATFVVFGSIGNDRSWANLVVLATIETGFCVALGAYVGARRDLVVALRERAERAEATQEVRASQARLAERSRIAREMHDVLAHKVSLIAMHAGALEVRRDLTPAQVAEAAGLIRTTAREAM